MHLEMSSAKSRPFCIGLNVLSFRFNVGYLCLLIVHFHFIHQNKILKFRRPVIFLVFWPEFWIVFSGDHHQITFTVCNMYVKSIIDM